MKVLHLTLKRKWFDLIESGVKREEYREIKKYWADRLTYHEHHERITCVNSLEDEIYFDQHRRFGTGVFKNLFDVVEFKNGYRKDSPKMRFKFDCITWGGGVQSGCRECHDYVEFKMSAEERREKGLLITKTNQTV